MTNTPRGEGPEPTPTVGPRLPAIPDYPDPAYAGQYPYGPTYQAPQVPDPTRQLPPYSPYGYDPYATGQYGPPYPPGEPPEGPPPPKSPRWLWVVAAVAVLLVVGLVIALVVANSSKQDTVVAPPPMPEPTNDHHPYADNDDDAVATAAAADRPGADHHAAQRVRDPGCNRDRGLRGQRQR